MVPILKAWNCRIFVSTRGDAHRANARATGVEWVGDATDLPPVALDSAITFAPSGDVVIAALRSLAKGGIVAINAIHLDRIAQFDYDSLLWGERQLRSVANMTRQDGRDFLNLAEQINLTPVTQTFPLAQANEAMQSIFDGTTTTSAVLIP
jgi:propanol-preferring alcohol dehydrogenase